MSSSGGLCSSCILAQAFNVTVGWDGSYFGFTERGLIGNFCESGQKLANLFDSARKSNDKVMIDLRLFLPLEVELSDY